MAPAFLGRLSPPAFMRIAERGCFIYAYLRRTDGTPYYIGLATQAHRPIRHHHKSAPVPPVGERHRIRVLRSGLSREEACRWEAFYISRFGRKDLGTGILLNRTAGGDGTGQLSPEARAKLSRLCSERMKGNTHTKGRPGTPHTEEHKRYISEVLKGRERSAEHRARISAAKKGKPCPKNSEAQLRASAERQGVPLKVYMAMTPQQRSNMRCWRCVNPGLPAMEYLRRRGLAPQEAQ
jgi:hypothetical protein